MKTNDYKILVLSDLKESSNPILIYAAKLANEIDAKVELLHVKGISDILYSENPLTVNEKINDIHNLMNKKMVDYVQPVSKHDNIDIETTFAFGNIKNTIENHIKTTNPDMIILGKSKTKRFKWLNNSLIDFVRNIYDGVIFEATQHSLIDEDGNISLDNLGLKNNIENYNTSKVKVKA